MQKIESTPPAKRNEPLIGYRNYQSGPFALIPNSPTELMFGWGSKIKMGLLEFDCSFKTIIPDSMGTFGGRSYAIMCEIQFSNKDGIPTSFSIYQDLYLEDSITYAATEYHDGSVRTPKNIKAIRFIIGQIIPYSEKLQAEYGDSVVIAPIYQDNPKPLWAGLRRLYTALQLVQTCYGFLVIPSP